MWYHEEKNEMNEVKLSYKDVSKLVKLEVDLLLDWEGLYYMAYKMCLRSWCSMEEKVKGLSISISPWSHVVSWDIHCLAIPTYL